METKYVVVSLSESRKEADKSLLETGGFLYTDNVQVMAKMLGYFMDWGYGNVFFPADVLRTEPKDCKTIFELKKVVRDGEEGYQLLRVDKDDPRVPKEHLPK